MKKIWVLIIIIPVMIGVGFGIYLSVKSQIEQSESNNKLQNVFGVAASKYAEVTKFDTFGTSLNIEGNIKNISKDNFEGIKLIVTDGADITEYYSVTTTLEDETLYFETDEINNSINLENLQVRNILCLNKTKT